jgi:hypothetical protein
MPGVITARVVGESGQRIEEVHLLTTDEIAPARAVREAEAALRVRFGVPVDPRCISITQTRDEDPRVSVTAVRAVTAEPSEPRRESPREPASEARQADPSPEPMGAPTRIRFLGLRTESRRASQVSLHVEVEWMGRRQHGEAVGADVPKARLETAALATLRAIERVANNNGRSSIPAEPRLALDGVQIVDAFDGQYVLAAVHAMEGRRARPLSGSALIEDSALEATVLATLKATDRWMRGRGRFVEEGGAPGRPGGGL